MILKEVKPFLKCTASFQNASLENECFLCFFRSNCMDKRTPHEADQAESGGLCCNRKKILLPPSWVENPLIYPREKQKISDQTAASPAPSPIWAVHFCASVAPGPCLLQAQPLPLLAFPFFLSLPGTASELNDQQSCYDTKRKIS